MSQRGWDDAHLVDAARQIHHDDPVFGYPFICDELKAEHGINGSENQVQRLCRVLGIYSVLAKKRGRWTRTKEPVHDDLVRREFRAAAPDALWFADITEHPTGEGKHYLCAIKDAFSNRIVGYSIDSCMKASLAVAALHNAIPCGDRSTLSLTRIAAVKFRPGKSLRALRSAGLLGSMGRTGACADNAAMESLFALVQGNVFNRKGWETRAELRLVIVIWINAPITAGVVSALSASSLQSSWKWSTRSFMLHEHGRVASQPKWGQSLPTGTV